MENYKEYFKGKTVLCNCDDPFKSNFFKYFIMNFNRFGLSKLISTSYVPQKTLETKFPYKAVVCSVNSAIPNNDITIQDISNILKLSDNKLTILDGNGDFRSLECLELLDEADIICTNPPFSLFREYVATLIEHKKEFIIIGNQNAITYKDFFPLLKDNKVWLGYKGLSGGMWFRSNYERKNEKIIDDMKHIAVPATWFTNIEVKKEHKKIILTKSYAANEYPKYDNYDAIEVKRVTDIPYDYSGVMGVPITFMDKYNPEQFEIIGISGELAGTLILPDGTEKRKPGRFYVNGKRLYDRIAILNKNPVK